MRCMARGANRRSKKPPIPAAPCHVVEMRTREVALAGGHRETGDRALAYTTGLDLEGGECRGQEPGVVLAHVDEVAVHRAGRGAHDALGGDMNRSHTSLPTMFGAGRGDGPGPSPAPASYAMCATSGISTVQRTCQSCPTIDSAWLPILARPRVVARGRLGAVVECSHARHPWSKVRRSGAPCRRDTASDRSRR